MSQGATLSHEACSDHAHSCFAFRTSRTRVARAPKGAGDEDHSSATICRVHTSCGALSAAALLGRASMGVERTVSDHKVTEAT